MCFSVLIRASESLSILRYVISVSLPYLRSMVVDKGVLSGNLILVIKVRTMEYSSIFMVLLYCASELSNSSVHLQAGIYI